MLKEEIQATMGLKHKHIVRYFEFKENTIMTRKDGSTVPVAFIAQEPAMGGELFEHVYHTGPFSEAVCRYYFKQMLQGIHYLHQKGYSHRDLKAENIVLDHNFDAKILDFGFAAPLEGRDGSGFNRTFKGTLGYMAPEILLKKPYQGEVVDMFALACILFVMRSGSNPFHEAAQKDDPFYQHIAKHDSEKFWQIHGQGKPEGYFSEEFKDLVTAMFDYHPQKRLCMADLIGHPWMMQEIPSQDEILKEFSHRAQKVKERAEAEREGEL